MLLIIISIVLLSCLIFTILWASNSTPVNLRGFYGTKYNAIGVITLLGIAILFVVGLIGVFF